MSELINVSNNPIVNEANAYEEVPQKTENYFKPLVQDARSTLRRIMLNSSDQKMAARVAESILDRAGEGARKPDEAPPNIVINDSQVNLLVQTQRELLGD